MTTAIHWFSAAFLGAAVAASLLAAVLVTDRALRAARFRRALILAYVSREGGEAGWVRSFDIRDTFDDMRVYPILRRLADRGILERREGPTSIELLNIRGGRSAVWYRIKRDRP